MGGDIDHEVVNLVGRQISLEVQLRNRVWEETEYQGIERTVRLWRETRRIIEALGGCELMAGKLM